jgi:hypothetical protein
MRLLASAPARQLALLYAWQSLSAVSPLPCSAWVPKRRMGPCRA